MATIIIYRIIQYLDFAVGTLSAMLDEFALNLRKVSDDSLRPRRNAASRRIIAATNFSQVFGNFFIVDIVAREHVVGNPLAIGRQIANTGLRERHFERDARRFRSKFTKGI